MSLVYLDSCGDVYTTSQLPKRWDVVTGSPTVSSSIGRRDSGGINLPTTGDRLQKNVPGLVEYGVGIAAKLDTLVVTDLFTLREGTTDHIIVRLTALGAVEVLRAPSTQLGITANGFIFAGFFNYIEIRALIDGAAGTIELDLNGTNLISLTSQNTDNSGAVPEIDNIEIEGSAGSLTIDDFYIISVTGGAPQNDLLGDTAVWTILPIGDGTTNDWAVLEPATPTTSFDKVDDPTPDDDASYVASDVPAALELFDMATVPDPGGTSAIFGVQLNMYARKDATTTRLVKGKARVNSTNYNGANQPLVSAYDYLHEVWEDDPDTAVQWIESGINAAEFGVEII